MMVRVLRWFALLICVFSFIRVLHRSQAYFGHEDLFNTHFLHLADVAGKDTSCTSNVTSGNNPHQATHQLTSACSTRNIPRIIHQTFKDTNIPQHWHRPYELCKTLHQAQWAYMFWTDRDAETFIAKNYPWFLHTFTHYKYDIQRADAIRYFILYHFGGIYLDLDVGCLNDLSVLLDYDAVLPKAQPWGVSNDVMASSVRHPFFAQVIENLVASNGFWGTKYPTVLFSTGPMFLSGQLFEYWKRLKASCKEMNYFSDAEESAKSYQCPGTDVRILSDELYANADGSLFQHYQGSTWHGADIRLVGYIAVNRSLVLPFFLLSVASSIAIWIWWRRRAASLRDESYSRLATKPQPSHFADRY